MIDSEGDITRERERESERETQIKRGLGLKCAAVPRGSYLRRFLRRGHVAGREEGGDG